MASIHVVSGTADAFPGLPVERPVRATREAAIKTFYFTSIVAVFAFILIVATGPHF